MKTQMRQRMLAGFLILFLLTTLFPTEALAAAEQPAISNSLQDQTATYTVGDSAAALYVTAITTDAGTLSYQWYSSTDDSASTASDDMTVGTDSSSYTPSTATPGTTYYYCAVTNTLESELATATSSVAGITVKSTAVYLKTGGTGNGTQSSPVGTFAAAKSILASGGTIYLDMSGGNIANSAAETWSLPSSEYGDAKVTVLEDTITTTNTTIIKPKTDSTAKKKYTFTLQEITIDISNITATDNTANLENLFSMKGKGETLVIGSGTTIICPDNVPCIYDSRSTSSENRSVTIASDASITGGVARTSASVLTITDNRASAATASPGTPIFITQPDPERLYGTGSFSEKVNISGSGILSFQWYSNTTGTVDTAADTKISGATAANYTPNGGATTTTYYYCVVTNTLNSQTATATSNVITVRPLPEVTDQPVGETYILGDSAEALTITFGTYYGELSYQWYTCTSTALDRTALDGATSTSYIPPTSAVGTTYYVCLYQDTYNGYTTSDSYSAIVKVTVNPVGSARITTQPVGVTYYVGGTAEALTVTATADSELSYQWYSNTTNSETSSTMIDDATTASYTPPTSAVGTTYYYCVVTNTLASVTSDIVAVTVTSLPTYDITSSSSSGSYTYSLSVNGVSVGTGLEPGTTSSDAAQPGDTVTFAVSVTAGNGLSSVKLSPSDVTTLTANVDGSYSFTMPSEDITLRITTKTIKTVTVTDGIANGTVTTDAGADFLGGSVTVTATPETGYRLKTISYSTDGGTTWTGITYFDSNTGTFSTSAANTLVTATFVESPGTVTVSTEAELIALAAAVNGGEHYHGVTISLSNDISLTSAWTPIGTYSAPFMGIFEGNGHTISGLNVYYDTVDTNTRYLGLFGYVYSADIENLTVSGTVTATENAVDATNQIYCYVGSIVGSAVGSSQLKNCVSTVDVSLVSDGFIGGIAGGFLGNISGCVNYGSVKVSDNTGANAGGVAGSFAGTLEQSGNYGDITLDTEVTVYEGTYNGSEYHEEYEIAYGHAGGVVGITSNSTDALTISRCFNKGTVTGWGAYMGGVIGYDTSTSTAAYITDCYNTGAVSMTAAMDKSMAWLACASGIVGCASSGPVALTNCYNAGALSNSAVSGQGEVGDIYCCNADDDSNVTVTNCYAADAVPAASVLGDKYQEDVNAISGGFPLLAWEETTVSDDAYAVTFVTTPSNATVRVYTDSALTNAVADASGVYSLKMGQYYYTASAAGYVTESSSFTVTKSAKTISVTLRAAATVTFTVTPAIASFTLSNGSEQTITPTSSSGGVYVYTIYAGDTYTYTATATGYNGTTREYTAVNGGAVTVALTESSQSDDNYTVNGGDEISEGGTYNIEDGAAGTITIKTAETVTLVGAGVSISDVYEDLYIDCTGQATYLIIKDVYISNVTGTNNKNMINFANGKANTLLFSGTSILDMNTGATGYAMVHVPSGSSLTVGGISESDTLYFYKREQGAGIGGNGGASGSDGQSPEYNGGITITGGNLFMKNSKQGALIGSGASAGSASGSPGDIIIQGGVLNLIAISRGAAIGGSAGSTGGSTGTDVFIYPNACVTINVDWSGSAIGGGGYAEGNDSDGGILHYYGGSIRTFIDYNAVASDLWKGVTSPGVNDTAITADKVNGSGKNVYLCTFNTSKLSKNPSTFTAKADDTTIYIGDLHEYCYVNEDLYKDNQIDANYTIDNWSSLDDSNLYLYLTGEDHTLTVNGETFTVTWDASAKTFAVTNAAGEVVGGSLGTDTKSTDEDTGKTITIDVTAIMSGKTGKATVDSGEIADAVTDALAAAAAAGTAAEIEISVETSDGCTTLQTTIPGASLSAIAGSEVSELIISSDLGSVSLNGSVLDSIASQSGGDDVTIEFKQVDSSTLTAEQKAAVGSGIVVSLSITSGDSSITSFDGNAVSFNLPVSVTVANGQTVKVYYLNSNNQLVLMEGVYDSSTGLATFTTVHLSEYVLLVEDVWTNPYMDVADTDWYYDAVAYVSEMGLFSGTSDTVFKPTTEMTRAMLVTVLWRLEGSPETESSGYTDVAADAWYCNAVNWASAKGIVTGYSADDFGPDDVVTREQLAVILYRYAEACGYSVSETADLTTYADKSNIAGWAQSGLGWANAEALISGRTDTTLAPDGSATRAEVATILMRFMRNVAL